MARLAVACAVLLALTGCGRASHRVAATAGPRLTPHVASYSPTGASGRARRALR